MVTNKKKKKYALYLHNDNVNSFKGVTEKISIILGYEVTQAANIAQLAHINGKYKFASYDDKVSAKTVQAMFARNSIKTEIQLEYEE